MQEDFYRQMAQATLPEDLTVQVRTEKSSRIFFCSCFQLGSFQMAVRLMAVGVCRFSFLSHEESLT